jgi:hypothetical protein
VTISEREEDKESALVSVLQTGHSTITPMAHTPAMLLRLVWGLGLWGRVAVGTPASSLAVLLWRDSRA